MRTVKALQAEPSQLFLLTSARMGDRGHSALVIREHDEIQFISLERGRARGGWKTSTDASLLSQKLVCGSVDKKNITLIKE